jgi:hypothetical protein
VSENLKELASRWIEYTARRHPEIGDFRDIPVSDLQGKDDAALKLIDLILSEPSAAFQVIDSILEQTSDPWVLTNLGAGPLEELLASGDQMAIRSVKELAARHSNARTALGGMWMQDFPQDARMAVEQILAQD